MNPIRAVGTSTFRQALVYLALFSVSSLVLLGFVYVTATTFMARQTEETIDAEITGLAEQYRRTGLAGLLEVLRQRSASREQSLYLLAGSDNRPLAGNIDAWPSVATGESGWLDFSYQRRAGENVETRAAHARHLLLQGGIQLLVGRDVQAREEVERLLLEAMIWSVAVIVALGLAGGLWISRNMLRRVERIGAASREIMTGDFSRRIPLSGRGDELDRLAENFNEMLERIEVLMGAMRHVSDDIAHDLRSPLNRLRSRLELALMSEPSLDSYRAALEDGVREAKSVLDTFNALLRISRIGSGARSSAWGEVDVAGVIEDVADLYRPLAEERQLRFETKTAPDLRIRGDRHLISQMLANLIDNAIKFSRPGGTVSVSGERTAARTEIIVADCGPGIAPADRERVFDRFVRLQGDAAARGSGLGLSLVRAVAKLHQATISIEDNRPGVRMILSFPA